eukprot:gb/GECH01008510.1/.p1 GENE.gb/GECH01008510.1/~~gb/GECH01008510.1/.p1  ORF type:complete len:116 (+),score=22.72 gb/GECH01008510.1/:1-348(+)
MNSQVNYFYIITLFIISLFFGHFTFVETHPTKQTDIPSSLLSLSSRNNVFGFPRESSLKPYCCLPSKFSIEIHSIRNQYSTDQKYSNLHNACPLNIEIIISLTMIRVLVFLKFHL